MKDDGDQGSWRAITTGYYYSLDDSNQKEIIAYHWHPTIGAIDFPYLHVEQGSGVTRRELFRAHLPTGHITLEDMMLCAIRDFKVQALRADWLEVLSGNKAKLQAQPTWS